MGALEVEVLPQLEVQAVDVLLQAREVDVHQSEAQVAEVLRQVVPEVDVLQLEVQAVEVLRQVALEVGVPHMEAQEAAVEALQWVELMTCASVWTRNS